MNEEYAKHETEYMEDYVKQGYTENFRITDGKLKRTGSEKEYSPTDICVHGEHRFEGMSNPSDMSILYALETKDGLKGIILAAYGPSSDSSAMEFMNDVPKKNTDADMNEPPED